MTTLKQIIHQKCVDLIDQKIAMHQKAMNDAQDAANKEQRSTAGDKYDTSRAMSQNERDMFARQLAESLQMKKVLTSLDSSRVAKKISGGSLVHTSTGNYYLSVSCGNVTHNGLTYFAISPLTPLGQAMLDKEAGGDFVMRNEQNSIRKVE
jgi:transcription elongation GreA/GreB family factor